MTKYICKCGREFSKSGNADTTGYRLSDYGPQHECYGCPYALAVTDAHWDNHKNHWDYIVRAWECRSSQKLSYSTYAALSLRSKNTGSIYSLDFPFLERLQEEIERMDGIQSDRGKPGDRGPQYGSDGLYRLPIYPDQNKKGIAAKQRIFDMFFLPDGSRNDVTPEQEKAIILKRIEEATMGKINIANINSGLDKVRSITDSLANVARFEMIPSDMIDLADYNPFAERDTDESRYSLAMSIQASGLIEPLAVNKKLNDRYKLISGEHRFTAIRQYLHWKTVPCMVFEGISDDEAQLKLYEANTYREYTSEQKFERYQELEQLLRRMKESGKFSGGIQKAIAERLGVTERQVRKYKVIDESLSEEQKAAVKKGEISVNDAYKMARPSSDEKSGTGSGFSEPQIPIDETSAEKWDGIVFPDVSLYNRNNRDKPAEDKIISDTPSTEPEIDAHPSEKKSLSPQNAFEILQNIYLRTVEIGPLKEAYKLALETVSKQIAKPLVKLSSYTYSCPTCGTMYGLSDSRMDPDEAYCTHCGQLTSGWRSKCKDKTGTGSGTKE